MKKLILLFIFCSFTSVFANNDVNEFFTLINKKQYEKATLFIANVNNNEIKTQLNIFLNLITQNDINFKNHKSSNNFLVKSLNSLNKSLFYYLKEGNEFKALNSINSSLESSLILKDSALICEASKVALEMYSRFPRSIQDDGYNYYLKLHKQYSYNDYEKYLNYYYQFIIELRFLYDTPEGIHKTFIIINNIDTENNSISNKLNYAIAVYYYRILKDYKTSFNYLKKIELNSSNKLNHFDNERALARQILLSVLEYRKGNIEKALIRVDSIKLPNELNYLNKNLNRYKLYWMYIYHEKLGNKYESYYYKSEFYELTDKLNSSTNQNLIVKYQAKEKDIKIQNQKRIFKYLMFGAILIITFTGVLSYLQLKNSRRKRLLAIQEKELETQKNLTLIKEQEITSINAMVEGQEKERKRVAEDLHDNLGSILATLKLHFENLKINREKKKINQESLFDKTEGLIDEAYLKVRSIAHAKNAGVIANQGLLVAIQMMAEKISSANAVQIEVIHFGLDKPIENSLEISLFRIIQELITNIIKHAEASQATIHISQYENNINIILEDNGKGMDVSLMNTQKGMGLHSIKTRITHLQGTFTIDSTLTKGTSILIDIPI